MAGGGPAGLSMDIYLVWYGIIDIEGSDRDLRLAGEVNGPE